MRRVKLLSVSLSILLLLSSCTNFSHLKEDQSKQVPRNREEISLSYAPVVKQVAPAVVNIYAVQHVKLDLPKSPFMRDPFFKELFQGFHHGDNYSKEQNSLGSGVIVSAEGLILTNYHVIENADEIRIVLSDKREYLAKLVNIDKRTDLALLKIEGGVSFPFLTVNSQEDLEVGDLVLAIGNPFGVGQTVTSGIISALARTEEGINDFRSFIQTDAAINPGNSGGALITTDGHLVGINTAIYSKGGGSVGIGFAIPIPLAIPVIASVKNGGHIVRPWLGIEPAPVTDKIIQDLSLPRPYGVVVNEVYPESPAAKAGLMEGDFIAYLNGHEIQDEASLDYHIAVAPVGQNSDLKIMRNGVEKTISVVLTEPMDAKDPDPITINGKNPLQGTIIKTLSPALAISMGINPMKKGVVVTELLETSPANQIGLLPGDIIESINETPVKTKDDAVASLQTKEHNWILVLRRANKILTLQVSN